MIPGTLFFCPESEGNTLTGIGDKEGDQVVQKKDGQENISQMFVEFAREPGP